MDAFKTVGLAWVALILAACSPAGGDTAATDKQLSGGPGKPVESTAEILVTSEQGDRIARKENVPFQQGKAGGTVITIIPEKTRQTITGIGSSFTESSAFVLAHLDEESRLEVMENLYGENGANFSLARTPIGATDFSVRGRYSYADNPGDSELAHFSIEADRDGFQRSEYPGIRDESSRET